MKEEWRETVAYYDGIRVCKVPDTHEETVTEEEWNDYVPDEARKVGHKVLCGFEVIKIAKKPKWKRNKRKTGVGTVRMMREAKVVSISGIKIAM